MFTSSDISVVEAESSLQSILICVFIIFRWVWLLWRNPLHRRDASDQEYFCYTIKREESCRRFQCFYFFSPKCMLLLLMYFWPFFTGQGKTKVLSVWGRSFDFVERLSKFLEGSVWFVVEKVDCRINILSFEDKGNIIISSILLL